MGITISTTVLASINTTGSSTTERATPKEGRSCSVSVFCPSPKSAPACRGTQRTMSRAASGPEMMTVGTATSSPKPSVRPMFALKASIAISGPGCGGTRPCRADRPASAGMPTAITGIFALRATSMTTGISSTIPTSKKRGIPITNATKAIAHGKALVDVRSNTVSTIWSAPPESISSFPIIAPNAISTPTPPTVEPSPLVKAVNVSVSGIAAISARTTLPSVSARKGCIFRQTINTTIVAIPANAAMISWGTLLVCATVSPAAKSNVFICKTF